MAAFNKFQQFVEDLGHEVHNLATGQDACKVMLTNVAPTATDAVKTDITEIAAGNGYTAGGTAIANTDWQQVTGTASLVGDDVVFTAAGGAIAQFRYAVVYNDTSASDSLISWWDYGSAVDLATGETFTVDFGATIATLA